MDSNQLTLWKLEIFCQVMEQGSFSKAARALHISQPTVSGHVADLERLFGTRLFDRNSGEIRPTRAGQLLFEQGAKLSQLRAETVRLMRNHLGLIEGDVLLGGSTIPGTYILPAYLAAFKRDHPDILISLRIGDSDQIVEGVLSGKLELGVVGSNISHSQLSSEPFVEDELVLILPIGHPLGEQPSVELAQLREQPFLVRERGSGTRQLMESAMDACPGFCFSDLHVVCELGSSAAIKESVRQGLGASLISIHAVRLEQSLNQLLVRRIDGLDLRRRFHIIRHQKRTASPPAKVLLELLRQEVS